MAFYFCEHCKDIKVFLEALNDDGMAIEKAKELFKSPEEPGQLELLASKMANVLQNNPGFKKLKNFTQILNGSTTELGRTNPNLPFLFSCAPIMSVDCEQIF